MAKVLYIPSSKISPFRTIAKRLGLLLALYAFVLSVFWMDLDGLRDNTHPDDPVGMLDLIYFTAVTLSTVGYGDIVPVTPVARAIDLVLVTPARMLVWLLFVGTTVQLTFEQFREEYALQKIRERLKNHIIICGFGMTGRAAAEELVCMGTKRENIVVVDEKPEECQVAADEGFVAMCGDGAREAILEKACIREASHIIVATGRDDTNVLICLTARTMNPEIRIAASVNQTENLKLIQSSGAAATVMPSAAGGHILAAATRFEGRIETLEDLLTVGGRIRIGMRKVGRLEAGKTGSEIDGSIVLGIERGGRKLPIEEVKSAVLEEGDLLVCLSEVKAKTVS